MDRCDDWVLERVVAGAPLSSAEEAAAMDSNVAYYKASDGVFGMDENENNNDSDGSDPSASRRASRMTPQKGGIDSADTTPSKKTSSNNQDLKSEFSPPGSIPKGQKPDQELELEHRTQEAETEAIDWDRRLKDLEREQQRQEEEENRRRRAFQERQRQQEKEREEALRAVGGLWFFVRGRGSQHSRGYSAEELRRDDSAYGRIEEVVF
jgi:hypothetical protein